MDVSNNDCNHVTHNVNRWPQFHAPSFCQEGVSSKQPPPDSLSEWTKPFTIQTPQIEVTTCGSQGTESSSFKTHLEAACLNYPVSQVQELKPSPKQTKWAEDQDLSLDVKDPNPVRPNTLCLTVEDPYFDPGSTPTEDSPNVVPEIWIENTCFEIRNHTLDLPKCDYNDKGMGTENVNPTQDNSIASAYTNRVFFYVFRCEYTNIR